MRRSRSLRGRNRFWILSPKILLSVWFVCYLKLKTYTSIVCAGNRGNGKRGAFVWTFTFCFEKLLLQKNISIICDRFFYLVATHTIVPLARKETKKFILFFVDTYVVKLQNEGTECKTMFKQIGERKYFCVPNVPKMWKLCFFSFCTILKQLRTAVNDLLCYYK